MGVTFFYGAGTGAAPNDSFNVENIRTYLAVKN